MKGKESKRAFIFFPSFLGIGTFQRVMPDLNKKIPWVTRRLMATPSSTLPQEQSERTAIGKSIAQESDFRNKTTSSYSVSC
jgi:hypothetical protein